MIFLAYTLIISTTTMSSNIYNFNRDNRKEYEKTKNKIAKTIDDNENLRGNFIDPKRQISYQEKEVVWNQAISNDSFDPEIFKSDPLGSVAIKYLTYNNATAEQRKFAYEYEHIISHSQFGKSVPGNICILNAGINRSKGKKPMTDVQFYEFKGLVSHYALTFNELLDYLENDLHSTCEHFNLYFYKNNQAKWSIHRDGRNYKSYGLAYKPKPIEIDFEAEPNNAALGAVVAGGVLIVANFIGEHVCIFGENVAFFIHKTFNPQPEPGTIIVESKPKPVKPVKPEPVKNTFIGLAVLAVAAAILSPGIGAKQRSSRNQSRRRRH